MNTHRQSQLNKSASRFSDDGGRKDTLISGFSDEELDDLDMSGTQLIEESKKADRKLALLMKQIDIMKSRA